MSLSQMDRARSLLTRISEYTYLRVSRHNYSGNYGMMIGELSLFKRLFRLLNSTSHALNRVIGNHSPKGYLQKFAKGFNFQIDIEKTTEPTKAKMQLMLISLPAPKAV